MNLQRCPNGHYYDADKYPRCPHCDRSFSSAQGMAQPGPAQGSTVAFNPVTPGGADAGSAQTVPFSPGPIGQTGAMAGFGASSVVRDEKTVGFFASKEKEGFNPVVGWLVCVNGKHRGCGYRLTSGRNFIGRTKENTVALEEESSVSRSRHAVVVFEPTQNIFLAQPGESTELFYVNGTVVLSATPLSKNDRIKVGDVELMLIPCCDEFFRWDTSSADEKK